MHAFYPMANKTVKKLKSPQQICLEIGISLTKQESVFMMNFTFHIVESEFRNFKTLFLLLLLSSLLKFLRFRANNNRDTFETRERFHFSFLCVRMDIRLGKTAISIKTNKINCCWRKTSASNELENCHLLDQEYNCVSSLEQARIFFSNNALLFPSTCRNFQKNAFALHRLPTKHSFSISSAG